VVVCHHICKRIFKFRNLKLSVLAQFRAAGIYIDSEIIGFASVVGPVDPSHIHHAGRQARSAIYTQLSVASHPSVWRNSKGGIDEQQRRGSRGFRARYRARAAVQQRGVPRRHCDVRHVDLPGLVGARRGRKCARQLPCTPQPELPDETSVIGR